jgi:GNAT superfamily N-acetyltransferase
MFEIRCISDSHIDEYINVLHERYYWLKEHNLDMWKIENLEKISLQTRYEDPIFYAGYEDGICIGGFILLEKDIRYWPNNLNDEAYYFHKFVVSPRFGHKGYSSKMLEWVKTFGKQNGKDYIRLDYQKNRTYLRNMYLKHGFIDISETITNEDHVLILGEFKIS